MKGLIITIIPFVISFTSSFIFNSLKPENDSYQGIVIEAKDNYFTLYSFPYRFYIYSKDNQYEVGDIIKVNSKVSEVKVTSYESQFNFEDYLKSKGIRYSLSSYGIEMISPSLIRANTLRKNFLSNFDEETKAMLDSLLFGVAHYETSFYKTLSSLNVVFLFSVSGIYFSFLITAFKFVLRKITKNENVIDFLPLVMLLPYSFFLFRKIGVIRATLLYILRLINKKAWKYRFKNIELVSLTGITLLLFDYNLAYQAGFYIGEFLSIMIAFFPAIKDRNKEKKWSVFLTPIFIYLFLLPLSSLDKAEFHLFYPIFTFLLFPVNEIFLLISLISFYTVPFTHVLPVLGKGMHYIYLFLDKFDLMMPTGDFSPYYIAFYYVMFFIIYYLVEAKKANKYIPLTIGTFISIILNFVPLRHYLINAIYFINVGQGDSILIKNKEHAVMIDTGGNISFDMASETLIPFLKKKQVYKLDALITTHDDYDHSGAKDSLMANFPVDNYLKDTSDFPYSVGDLYFDNLNKMESDDENDSSLVFNLDFMNKKWLFTGDASIEVEKNLLKTYPKEVLDADILKVGHHGSKTSTSEEFLKVVSPYETIISAGKKNKYGHPNQEVIDLLNKYNVNIRYTYDEGTIAYISL